MNRRSQVFSILVVTAIALPGGAAAQFPELDRGITYYHIGYAVIAAACLGSGARLLFRKQEKHRQP